MDALNIFALVILILIAALIGVAIWFFGSLPGKVAHDRNHPYARSIQVGGWATLFLGIVGWPFVLMWAYAGRGAEHVEYPESAERWQQEIAKLQSQVDSLSQQIQRPGGGTP